MEKLKDIMDSLETCVLAQMDDISQVEAQEMGMAVDMIKDISMAMYYVSIAEAMANGEAEVVDGRIKI